MLLENPLFDLRAFRSLRRYLVAAAALFLCSVGSAATPAPDLDPAPPGSFTIVAIPDTQEYHGKGTKLEPQSQAPVTNPEFDTESQWVLDHLQEQRVAFVTQLGDIVDKPKIDAQWELARQYMSRFDGAVPYGIVVGNHDMAKDGDSSQFQKYFPAAHFTPYRWYAGTCEGDPALPHHCSSNADSCQLFTAGGTDFVILHLECNAPDVVVQWADGMLKKYAQRTALISTHMDLGLADGDPVTQKEQIKKGTAALGRMKWSKSHEERGNTPVALWDKLYRQHANLLAIFSADQGGVQAYYQASVGDQGNLVHGFMSDYGTAAVRLYRFLPSENKIRVITYDTEKHALVTTSKYVSDPARHQFEVTWKPAGAVAPGAK